MKLYLRSALLVKLCILLVYFISSITLVAQTHEIVSLRTDSTEINNRSPKENVVFDPSTHEFPSDALNGGSDVALEKADYNPSPIVNKAEKTHTWILWTITIILILFFIVMIQVVKILGQMRDLAGEKASAWLVWNPRIFLLFMIGLTGSVIYELMVDTRYFFPESASEHGVTIDSMFNITSFFVLVVFFITQITLFAFTYIYRARPGHTAYYYPHNDKLEIVWTVIPAIALSILITKGLKTWNGITSTPPEGTKEIELYAFQFGWKVRYPGADLKLGEHNFRLISAENDMGINWKDDKAKDDIVPSEIHLVVNKTINFKFRAKDVIHSAWMPYFRAQMNVVPGVPTQFWLRPTITTSAMREVLKKRGDKDADKFDYYIYCNKICGAAHYNMKIKIVVESQSDFDTWMKDQKPVYTSLNPPASGLSLNQ